MDVEFLPSTVNDKIRILARFEEVGIARKDSRVRRVRHCGRMVVGLLF